MNQGFIIGFAVTFLIFLCLSISSGIKAGGTGTNNRQKKGSNAMVVSGAIIGTLVGGSSTIGTAQLAYTYGLSAWWFTMGSGMGCLILALVYVKPFRRKCKTTLTGMITENYGLAAGTAATCFSASGMYINIIAQLISAASIIMMILPGVSLFEGIFISAILMMLYAISGGVNGVGKLGVFKTALLYITTIGGGIFAIWLFGGIEALLNSQVLQEGNYFSLFNRGVGKDLGNGISVVLGVLSTQTYAQAVVAGRTDSCARKGVLLSAVMIPPIGVGGILIGMYMRVSHPGLSATKFALPMFVQQNMPPLLSGLIFATLLITVLGTGAGLALGIGTTMKQDIIQNGTIKIENKLKRFLTERKLIALTLLTAAFLASSGIGDFILDFSFMSMALRAAGIFIPIQCLLFFQREIPSACVLAAIISGPIFVLAGSFMNLSFDPLFLGVFVNLIIIFSGYIKGNHVREMKRS